MELTLRAEEESEPVRGRKPTSIKQVGHYRAFGPGAGGAPRHIQDSLIGRSGQFRALTGIPLEE